MALKDYNFWFVTGSQSLYGEETLRQVDENSKQIVLTAIREHNKKDAKTNQW